MVSVAPAISVTVLVKVGLTLLVVVISVCFVIVPVLGCWEYVCVFVLYKNTVFSSVNVMEGM